jgi:hypothetical protein
MQWLRTSRVDGAKELQMLIDEQRYCDLCHGVIVFGQKHVQIRSGESPGKSRFDCRHYHYRFKGDCWDQQQRYFPPQIAARPAKRSHISPG